MIKYNSNNINDWDFGTSNIIKVYRNGAVCYYKVTSGDTPTPVQEPCFAVVDDISQYSDTEFEDVFNKANEKWYKLNNLNNYEEYGVYGSGRTITYYDGKLTIDDGYEYQYSGASWYNVGEVSGSSRLPAGYTELEYIQSNSTSQKTLIKLNYHANNNTRVVADMQRMSGASGNPRLFGCGWYNKLGYQINIEKGVYYYKFGQNSGWYQTSTSADYNRHVFDFNNNGEFYVDSTLAATLPTTSFTSTDDFGVMGYLRDGSDYDANEQFYGKMYSFKLYESGTLLYDLVPAKRDSDSTIGVYDLVNNDFYTAYANGPFIAGPESGGTTYPIYYDVIQDPPNNLSFSSMTEAEEYECPYVGMKATIDGDSYVFSGDSISGYEWVYIPPTQFISLQDLASTYPTQSITKAYRFTNYSDVSGITYFRYYPSKGTSQSSYVYSDHNADNATGTTKFAIKADENGSLFGSIGGYSSLKEAADATACTWAYWIDADTIEIDVVAAVGTTIFIKQWQTNFVTDIIAYKFG